MLPVCGVRRLPMSRAGLDWGGLALQGAQLTAERIIGADTVRLNDLTGKRLAAVSRGRPVLARMGVYGTSVLTAITAQNTLRVTVEKKPGDQWERIVGCELGDKPPRLDDPDNLPDLPETVGVTCGIPDEDLPF